MAEVGAMKWESMKKKSISPPDEDSLQQHGLHVNCLAYLVLSTSLPEEPPFYTWTWLVCHIRHAFSVNLHQVKLTKSKNDSHNERENGSSVSKASEYFVSKCSNSDSSLSPSFIYQLNSGTL